MFFLPPDEFWYLTVAKLELKFDDNRKGAGTGFFIYDYKNYYLVTARHVVDPTYDPTKKRTQARLIQLDMGFQCAINPGTPEATHGYHGFTVTNIDFNYADDDVDVAVLKIPSTVLPSVGAKGITRPCSFSMQYLATDEDLATRYAGEPVIFVGYPDNAPIHEIEGKNSFIRFFGKEYFPIHRFTELIFRVNLVEITDSLTVLLSRVFPVLRLFLFKEGGLMVFGIQKNSTVHPK